LITRKVVMTGEVISDAESGRFPGFFAFMADNGKRMYAPNSDYSATKILRPGQRVEWVSVTYSRPWGKKPWTKTYVRVARQHRGLP
jgi:hypothetical protein